MEVTPAVHSLSLFPTVARAPSYLTQLQQDTLE